VRKNVTCTCLYWCLGRIIPLSLWKSSMSPPRYTTQTACILFFSMLLSLEVLRALVLRNNAVSREVGSSFATGETLENHHFTAPLPVEKAVAAAHRPPISARISLARLLRIVTKRVTKLSASRKRAQFHLSVRPQRWSGSKR
jgi:hypothetical protein